jgi:hypothetical protein
MEESNSQQKQQPPAKMKRNLLLCVDAFGTLFRPRSPIAEQYGQVARGMGVKISDEEIAREFKTGESLFRCVEIVYKWSREENRDWLVESRVMSGNQIWEECIRA